MGYSFVKLPLWAAGLFAGTIWSLGMLVLPSARDSRASLGVVLVGGVLFGTVMALIIRRLRRRFFAVGGRALSGRERLAVVRAVHKGERLPDGDLRAAAHRYAERQYAQNRQVWPVMAMVVVLGGLSAWLAVSDSPWWWIGVVLWPVVGGLLIWQSRRQRVVMRRYLERPVTAGQT
jgi:hypothetical protein